MTNLLEKTLLIGFGIFMIMIFFILITPFIENFTSFKENHKDDVDNYNNTINKINYYNSTEIKNLKNFLFLNVEKISYLKHNDNLKVELLEPIIIYIESFFLKNLLKIFYIKSSI